MDYMMKKNKFDDETWTKKMILLIIQMIQNLLLHLIKMLATYLVKKIDIMDMFMKLHNIHLL
jgi:hypothetical protein